MTRDIFYVLRLRSMVGKLETSDFDINGVADMEPIWKTIRVCNLPTNWCDRSYISVYYKIYKTHHAWLVFICWATDDLRAPSDLVPTDMYSHN